LLRHRLLLPFSENRFLEFSHTLAHCPSEAARDRQRDLCVPRGQQPADNLRADASTPRKVTLC
jgi:hypothetical protein